MLCNRKKKWLHKFDWKEYSVKKDELNDNHPHNMSKIEYNH